MTYVFTLNMTYDVPVKFLSFHLILLSLFLLAPQFRRLANFFFLNRAVEPAPPGLLFRSRRANRITFAVQALFALWLIGIDLYGARVAWKQYGPGVPTPALYGIWNVEQFTTDGQPRPPLLTDTTRWRRIVFEKYDYARRSADERYADLLPRRLPTRRRIRLPSPAPRGQNLTLTVTRPASDQLFLDGPIDGHPTHIQFRLQDRTKFLLVNRGFHWIQEYPFNR